MIWTLFIATVVLSLWAAARVKPAYCRFNKLPVRSGRSAAEVAAEIRRRRGTYAVEIAEGEAQPQVAGMTSTSNALTATRRMNLYCRNPLILPAPPGGRRWRLAG